MSGANNQTKMKTKITLILLIALSFTGCSHKEDKNKNAPETQEWTLVFRNDENGKPIFGDKDELISLVRKGYAIKIGWASRRQGDTTKTVEHTVDAEFLTIANGEEVFAQIRPFLAQRPDLTSDTLSMTLMPVQLNWILGTNGIISSANIDISQDSIRTSPPKLFGHGLSWFVKISSPNENGGPLWD